MARRGIRLLALSSPLIVSIVWIATRSPSAIAITAVAFYLAVGMLTGPLARVLHLPTSRPDVAYVTLLERWWDDRRRLKRVSR
jgi:hypothetical protein